MEKSKVFSRLGLSLPICCCGKIVNKVYVPIEDEENLCESYGLLGEEQESDICDCCKELGVLEGPLPYFLEIVQNPNTKSSFIISMNMSLNLFESMARLLKNEKEDNAGSFRKVYCANEATCGFADEFHIFEFDGVKCNKDRNLEEIPFLEKNKVAIVTDEGISLSCDVFSDSKYVATVESMKFSLEDLTLLNGWIVNRVGLDNIDDSDSDEESDEKEVS